MPEVRVGTSMVDALRGTAVRAAMRVWLAVAMIVPAGGVVAQVPVGEAAQNSRFVSRLDATKMVAGCIIGHGRNAAARWVTTDFKTAKKAEMTPGQRAALSDIRTALNACVHVHSLTLNGAALRGVLAERLLKDDRGALLARARTSPMVAPRRIDAGSGEPMQDALFDCIVRAEPAKAAALLDADAATPEEASIFRSLAPSLQACVPLHAAVHIRPGDVRFQVAISLYRQASAVSGI